MDINERAKQLRKEQQAAREEATRTREAEVREAQQQRRENERRAQEVHELLNHFLKWAKHHKIPYDTDSSYEKHSLFGDGYKDKRLVGWMIASHPDSYTVDGDLQDTTRQYVITNGGRVFRSFIRRGGYEEGVVNLGSLTIESIEEHIAGFVAKHNIPWD